ncbi:hypothetical protein WJX74_000028 [Apatococcus lobatus]|uniref:Uncharacterized protein n=1 Tax=Apatococcus lobatus TaxID=904363 RepID=A0AAW1S9R6_9CHLO
MDRLCISGLVRRPRLAASQASGLLSTVNSADTSQPASCHVEGFCPALTEEMEREKSVYSDELLASQSRREPEAQPWSWFRWFLSCCSCCVFIPQYPPRRLWHESPQGKERKRRGEMTEGEAGEDQGASAPLAMLPTEGIQQPLL